MDLGYLVDDLTAEPSPGGNATLAVLAELHDDSLLRQRCRQALAGGQAPIAGWAVHFEHATVHKTMRIADVVGDFEYVLVEAHIGEHALTSMVRVDHDRLSEVSDAFFFPDPLDDVLAQMRPHNDERDFDIREVTPVYVQSRITAGLDWASRLPIVRTDNWPDCRPILQWLARLLPDAGINVCEPQLDSTDEAEVFDEFFASPAGSAFDDVDCRGMLEEVSSAGIGGALRWSAARLERVLDPRWPEFHEDSVASQLELPRLLRAYVPFAHRRVGARDALTVKALAVIRRLGPRYQQAVLELRHRWEDDEFLGAG